MCWLPYPFHTSHHPSQTSCLPWISYASQKLMLDSCKMLQKQSEAFHTFFVAFFPSLKHDFIAYRSSKVSSRPDCIFKIHYLWQSGFSRVYSNSFCSCSFPSEIIKIRESSHKMYSNNILIFKSLRQFLIPVQKGLETYWMHHVDNNRQFESGLSIGNRLGDSRLNPESCFFLLFLLFVLTCHLKPFRRFWI